MPRTSSRTAPTASAWHAAAGTLRCGRRSPRRGSRSAAGPAPPSRRRRARRDDTLNAACAAFPDNRVKHPYDLLFGDEEHTAFISLLSGTFTGPLELPDGTVIEPTG